MDNLMSVEPDDMRFTCYPRMENKSNDCWINVAFHCWRWAVGEASMKSEETYNADETTRFQLEKAFKKEFRQALHVGPRMQSTLSHFTDLCDVMEERGMPTPYQMKLVASTSCASCKGVSKQPNPATYNSLQLDWGEPTTHFKELLRTYFCSHLDDSTRAQCITEKSQFHLVRFKKCERSKFTVANFLLDITYTPVDTCDPSFWNGNKEYNLIKWQIATTLQGTSISIGDPQPGRRHDLHYFTPPFPIHFEEDVGLVDGGYASLHPGHFLLPYRESKNKKLTRAQALFNANQTLLRSRQERFHKHIKRFALFGGLGHIERQKSLSFLGKLARLIIFLEGTIRHFKNLKSSAYGDDADTLLLPHTPCTCSMMEVNDANGKINEARASQYAKEKKEQATADRKAELKRQREAEKKQPRKKNPRRKTPVVEESSDDSSSE